MNISRSVERFCLFALFLIFIWFTWRGLTMFYSGDDMMNMYGAWNMNPWRLARAELMIWIPLYRPLGAAIYRIFYAVFGFHPAPLYICCWLMLAANVLIAYRWFRITASATAEALIALSLVLVHGTFQDLYLSAGTIYDRLWFLFTILGLVVYAKWRRSCRLPVLVALCILSMDSKESGVALPLLLACYEGIFILPEAWKSGSLRARLRQIAPLYFTLAIVSLLFVFLRVKRTPELTGAAAYTPHASLSVWLTRMAEYFGMLTYRHVPFSAWMAGAVLVLMAVAAVLLRNRAMMFGWLFFVITITPVALISSRPGYVLYVPDIGLGMYFAAAIALTAKSLRVPPIAAFALVTVAITWFHVRNWPPPFDPWLSPELRFSEQFRREYPKLPAGTKLLFVSDEFPKLAYDLLFNLRLLYNDRSLIANRLDAPPDQQPDPKHPIDYDHVFAQESGRYIELDNNNVEESIRLHILRDYAVGRQMDIARRDFPAYVVSGLLDGDIASPTRWTAPRARFKFDLYPAPAIFAAKFWVPDFVAKPALRKLSILVDGKDVGTVALTHDGMNEIAFPVSADLISASGYTIVDLNVDNPYKDAGGQEFGVVLLKAGFEYRR